MTLGQLIWNYKEILHTKFQGLKVWVISFLYVCFLLFNNRKSFENAAKSAFSIKQIPKIELFNFYHLNKLIMRSCIFIIKIPPGGQKKPKTGVNCWETIRNEREKRQQLYYSMFIGNITNFNHQN